MKHAIPSPRSRVCAWLGTLLMLFSLAFAAQAQTVIVDDTSEGGGPGGGTFFMLLSANGVDIKETAFSASASASFGRGAYMVVRGASRTVGAGKVTLKIQGLQAHVAPIDTIFRAIFRGGNPEVVGTVTVELTPGERYRVNGFIDTLRREVWIEDSKGVRVADSFVAAAADPAVLKQMEGAAFVTSNLRYDGDWISEAPSLELPFVPLGSRLKVIDYGSNRASVLIDGRKMRMGIDWTRGKETIQQYVARVTSTTDPRVQLADYPERIRNAIRAGRVVPGMNRDQVLQALGRPRVDYTASLEEREWRYAVAGQGDLYVVFDEAGLVKELDASRHARKLVVYESP